jgi:hypothetical protein
MEEDLTEYLPFGFADALSACHYDKAGSACSNNTHRCTIIVFISRKKLKKAKKEHRWL